MSDQPKKAVQSITWELALKTTSGLVVLAIVSLLSWIAKKASSFLPFLEPFQYHLAGLVFLTLLLIVIVSTRRFNRLRPIFPRLSTDFRIKEHEVTYRHQTRYKMTYTRRKKLKALRNGLDRYKDRYDWTGRGHLHITSEVSSQKVEMEEKRSIWQFYAIKFNAVLNKGKETETCLRWDLEDTERVSVPFISVTVEEPTDILILKVFFPDDENVTHVNIDVTPFMGAKIPFEAHERPVRDKQFVWTIKKPRLLYHYELRWDWV
ncbi:TPA: hypothetical protein DIV49_03790 [Candidatus Saccharibacteria bacterium]|nr:hypothetical protein [Candidatus Saccharibacteria bacterium]